MGGVDGQGVQKSGLGLALFGDVLVSRMRRRLLAFGLSELILDFFWIGGEDGSQSFRELLMLTRFRTKRHIESIVRGQFVSNSKPAADIPNTEVVTIWIS